MVYRYESDEDAFVQHPGSRSDLPDVAPGPPAPAGPSPSRFPTPSLPRATPPALGAPEPPPAEVLPDPEPIPVRSSVQVPPPPPTQGYAPTEPPDLPRSRRSGRGGGRLWQVLVGGAAVLVLLALCGLGAAALLVERTSDTDRAAPGASASAAAPTPEPSSGDLDSRDTDQQPLTAKEVFPGTKLVVADGQPAYTVLKTHSGGSCAVAATGEIADLLVRLGCSQVVRATLRSPDGEYLVTAGLFNLTDKSSAQRARDRIRQMLDDRQGRFRGLAAGEDTEAITTAAARVGWQVRGHYVAYCLVVRADGGAVPAGDGKVREILYEMIELHLNQGVLDRRAAGGTAVQPTTGSRDSDQGGEELPGD
ncbi:hypothetical protein [Micromonospora coxensis]|uniref:Uncharacterized protein n=1 Tax=Micromonospora coxensis TaxID=356852 RepID=A0A1C5IBG2_9ACTN|nr:hypothetical protein [Micromonospora coxensis]SCG55381.1 hypothetical protein GA0070614_2497 [Micromonospora coxensis]